MIGWFQRFWQGLKGFFIESADKAPTAKSESKAEETDIDFEQLSEDQLDQMLREQDDLVRQMATQGPQNLNLMAVQIFAGHRENWEEELRALMDPPIALEEDLPFEAYFKHVEAADKCRDWHQRLEPQTQFELAVLMALREEVETIRVEWKRQTLKLADLGEGPTAQRLLFYLGGINRGPILIEKMRQLTTEFSL